MKTLTWKTEKRKVADLIPADYNPRKMTEEERKDLEASIKEFGTAIPLVINIGKRKDHLIGGHQRTTIYADLGITEIDVMVPNRELTVVEEKKLNLRLNKNTGSWDYEKLKDMDMSLLLDVGFVSEEVDFLKEGDDDDEDDFDGEKVAENIKKPTVKIGDMFRLGEHTLLCGDSTKSEDLAKLMGGVKADMVFTDPPFNMNYKSKVKGAILNDNMEAEAFIEFATSFISRMKENLKTGGVFYICSGYNSYIPFRYALEINEIAFSSAIVWVKNSLVMGMNDYRHQHELILKAKKEAPKRKKAETILYGWNGGKHYFAGGHDEADVWNVKRRGTNTMSHPTQKPLALVNKAIKNSSKHEGVVLDLFVGSGSTLISCEKTGRKCYGMELDPKYVESTVMRWESLTQSKAEQIYGNKK